MTLLDEIFAHKRAEVAYRRQMKSLSEAQRDAERAAPPLDFVAALRASPHLPASPAPQPPTSPAPLLPALIAEVKHRSPSRGVLMADFDPVRLARIYRQNGAAAISVLTDEHYFGGSLDHLCEIAELTPRLPVLRKDFICDPYQVYEARAAGADAVLLIAAHLEARLLRKLHTLILRLGMTPLVEVHTLAEIRLALTCEPKMIGINNRDLRDFTVSLETTFQLRPHIPSGVMVISESGIHTREDAIRLAAVGVDAMLIGEGLVTASNIAAKVREMGGRR